MNIKYASINSGSNGNCYFIGTESEAILVDAGISCKEILIRLERLEISPSILKGIFISHEHSDHIKGLEVFVKKFKIPVYISERTYLNSRLSIDDTLIRFFNNGDQIQLGNLSIDCFNKIHDAADPHSFTILINDFKIGVFTDLGRVCSNLIEQFKSCNVVFLEANYDAAMLENSAYPYYLKNRIRNGMGHLSNDIALELFKSHKSAQLSHLLLSHLSKNNNCPDLLSRLFEPHAGNTHIEVVSRDRESKLFKIDRTSSSKSQFTANIYQTVLF